VSGYVEQFLGVMAQGKVMCNQPPFAAARAISVDYGRAAGRAG